MASFFVVFEGLDGSGKGEMLCRLQHYLFCKDRRFRVLATREPTYGTYGLKIRELLQKDADPLRNAEVLLGLYVRDRKDHLAAVIEPFLSSAKGDDVNIVLCDRYYHSTIAFQTSQGIAMQKTIDANSRFRKPDLTLILDVPSGIALQRIERSRSGKEKFEQKEFMEQLRKHYLMLKEKLAENIVIIDASPEKDTVFAFVQKEADKALAGITA